MTNTKKRPALRAVAKPLLGILVLLALGTPTFGCPLCKDSCPVDSTSPTEKVADANQAGFTFNTSIYFMLGGLASAIGLAGRVMYKAAVLTR